MSRELGSGVVYGALQSPWVILIFIVIIHDEIIEGIVSQYMMAYVTNYGGLWCTWN